MTEQNVCEKVGLFTSSVIFHLTCST